ncbi:glycosyltransferase family 4 protein [Synechococcus sp. PCC 7336]|uniref:glycosyltransferase family 4 protein n=1 Tax=Synechococcus sp. PCC 7336 TaxID=195250 RepID=UPI0003480E18|nr:glycosyltransferase family 4 protein [Synechococcus sp. PCC 7336]
MPAIPAFAELKVAIVHEWLIDYSGSERVVEQLLTLFPHADLYAVVENLPVELKGFIQHKPVRTTFIQNLPWGPTKYQNYLPFMPMAIEQLDLSNYDLILSSSHAVAKGVLTGPSQCHISYVHSPMRYAWDLQHQYLRESGFDRGPKGWLARYLLHNLRQWDRHSASGVDYFAANSQFIARRIWKIYRRSARVIYPPVNANEFELYDGPREDYYLAACRMVPYKRMELIVEAFSQMPDKRLVAIGDGPGLKRVQQLATSNIEVLGYQSMECLREYMQKARAFVFAAQEDFGITVVEAQACGTPVIAYGAGGALETVKGLEAENPTGVLFGEQAIASLKAAIEQFEKTAIRPLSCRENALRFSVEQFRSEFATYAMNCWNAFWELN